MGHVRDEWFNSGAWKTVVLAVREAGEEIRHESEHDVMMTTWTGTDDKFEMEARCGRCGRRWGKVCLLTLAMVRSPDRWIRNELIPWAAYVMESKCYSMIGRQQIQELLIEWLKDAGPVGMPWSRAMHMLILSPDWEAGDITEAMNSLELEVQEVDGTPMLRLPDGHPDRDW